MIGGFARLINPRISQCLTMRYFGMSRYLLMLFEFNLSSMSKILL